MGKYVKFIVYKSKVKKIDGAISGAASEWMEGKILDVADENLEAVASDNERGLVKEIEDSRVHYREGGLHKIGYEHPEAWNVEFGTAKEIAEDMKKGIVEQRARPFFWAAFLTAKHDIVLSFQKYIKGRIE